MKSYSFQEFQQDYPNDDVCLDTIFKNTYGETTLCPKCGIVDSKFYKLANRKAYSCVNCRYQIHPLAGTIFHKSDTPLTKWFYALYMYSVSKNGVSAKELERALGVTYKCAYRINKKIRDLMRQNADKLTGIIEADETYIGGTRKKWQQASPWDNKTAVIGMTERGGQAKARVGFADATTAVPLLTRYVEAGSVIHTDESRIYTRVKRTFDHKSVNHSVKQYVSGDVHTNSIEGFWGQLKRSLHGTYHAVSPLYLQSYVDQFVFFYNHRDVLTFPILLAQAARPDVPVGQTYLFE